MLTNTPRTSRELEIAGLPAIAHLPRPRRLSQQLLDHLARGGGGAAPGAVLPCGVARREAGEVVAGCLELVAAALQGRAAGRMPEPVQEKIADWAADGVALEAVQHATHVGFRFVLDLLARHADGTDSRALVVAGQRLAEVLDGVITTFTSAYMRELRTNTAMRQAGAEALAAALIAGTSTPELARECGFRGAEAYAVLALTLSGPANETVDDGHDPVGALRRLRRLRGELTMGDDVPPARLSEEGGTVLIPSVSHDDATAARLFERLRMAAGDPLLATVVHARRDQIPEATRRAHELLDLAQRLNRPARLYGMADLAVEYQITRPGPARRRLAKSLDPLLAQPELLQTLSTHLANDRNRKRTARALYIHANTIDYRLRRIARLTGLDPADAEGLWQLQAALIAHAYETVRSGPDLSAPAPLENPGHLVASAAVLPASGPPVAPVGALG
ncbi:PucR family transcriptional regulator [Nocardia flavorosea]|uniref:PucR family transcriptional regulator n=1 Tax=Nocardia flavorosea TaxID=53429 RepID=A0A846YLP2_9NOCA|nr:helix-turn-helix domain-containing protein [Nocardia flavorosea]NKY58504.1 PucR family transcriptional regulator [Nocardia flavorosea]